MNKQYIYPQNMRASATLWLWSLKDFAIIVVGALFFLPWCLLPQEY